MTCRFFDEMEPSDEFGCAVGQCRRHAPTMVGELPFIDSVDDIGDWSIGVWPTIRVAEADWCGEYQQ